MKRADHVLAVVQEAKEAYKKSGIESEKITIVSNTVDTDWFDRYSSGYEKYDTDEFMITYSGGLSGHHRGLDTAVKSQPIINSEIRDAKLRMAGGGPLEENLKNLAQRLNIKENIEFTGWVDFTEIPKYVRAADVGIVPHRSNPHTNTTVPHKLFHYMASGIPVIVTETDAVARIVRETNSGLVVPPEDSEAFAEAAVELADSDRRTELGENGRMAVEKKYNWSCDEKRLQEVYDSLGV
jgi:glycosyltransferase involved in cell wall biosynthesis